MEKVADPGNIGTAIIQHSLHMQPEKLSEGELLTQMKKVTVMEG